MRETADRDGPPISPEQRELLDQVLDKWSLQVIEELCDGPLRFNELRRALPVITQKSLAATLRRLERNGMVEREVRTRPVAVEYRISSVGRSLETLMQALLGWTATVLPEVRRAREGFDAEDADHPDADQVDAVIPRPRRAIASSPSEAGSAR